MQVLALLPRRGGAGSTASGRCRSSGTRCSPTAGTLALLTPDAKITWLCHPRPGLPGGLRRPARRRLGRLLPRRPRPRRRRCPLGQRYRRGTMTVETRWSGLTVTDSRRSAPTRTPEHHAGARARPGSPRRGSSSRRGPSSARCRSSSSRVGDGAAGLRLQRADGAALPRRGVGDRRRRRPPDRHRRRWTCRAPAARWRWSCGCGTGRAAATGPQRARAADRRRSGRWRDWVAGAAGCPPPPASWCCAAR